MLTRRGLFGFLFGTTVGAGLAAQSGGAVQAAALAPRVLPKRSEQWPLEDVFFEALSHEGDDKAYGAWFKALEIEDYENGVLTISSPMKFLKNWIEQHYMREFNKAGRATYGPSFKSVRITVRSPTIARATAPRKA